MVSMVIEVEVDVEVGQLHPKKRQQTGPLFCPPGVNVNNEKSKFELSFLTQTPSPFFLSQGFLVCLFVSLAVCNYDLPPGVRGML